MYQFRPLVIVLAFLLGASLVCPLSATVVARDVRVEPGGAVLSPVNVTIRASVEIIPSGATTFSETHTLVLFTTLTDPRWVVTVTVDGREAAVFSREVSRVFINGYLLSYPTTRDVAVRVLLEGKVDPSLAGGNAILLEWEELNAQGEVVTGSGFQVTRNVQPSPAARTPAETPPGYTHPVPTPVGIPFPVWIAIGAFCLVVFGSVTRRRG
ncbi:MAG: hypothetical protein NQU46_02635 [Methanolinea sp.]|nr:hypothetical protein [Methanolinea sp.]